uniref:BED-type domain-containing protein n=1 Tax=Amphimedon queenslandica TaxID=400682 RepID=A0A1X7SZE2_AMPQE
MARPSPLCHFVLPTNTSGNYKAECKHCGTFISGSGKTKSNFTTHLKRQHLKIYEESQKTAKNDDQVTLLPFIGGKMYSTTDPCETQANDVLISLVAEGRLSFSIVETSAFKRFTQVLDSQFVVPSRNHLSYTLLESTDLAITAKVKDQLHLAKGVALTLDLWSNRQMRGYLGITCHFSNDNWAMQYIMLCCKRFWGRHTAENIAHCHDEVTSAFNISDKVTTVATDNAFNVVKAFLLPGFHDTDDEEEILRDDDELHEDDGILFLNEV